MIAPPTATLLFLLAIITQILAQSNCTADSVACLPRSSCCPTGYFCNFNRGIPVCQSRDDEVISGFRPGASCPNDPYLISCAIIGHGDVCCPLGNICFSSVAQGGLSCIDAYGNATAPYPSTISQVTPPGTLISSNAPSIVYSPEDAWSSPSVTPNCTVSGTSRVTSMVNASISFNYTGTSIRVHTVTSPRGGLFSVIVDGFNTSTMIDTYSGGDNQLPQCFPFQFPPFAHPPPDMGARNEHSITLVYTGPSSRAPNGTTSSEVQFDTFAIPIFQTMSDSGSDTTVFAPMPFSVLTLILIMVAVLY